MTQRKKFAPCPYGIVSIGGICKVMVVNHLFDGTKRFGELQRLIPEASRQMLTLQLRELEQVGLVHRQVYAQMPPKVEYSLTEMGRNVGVLLNNMYTQFSDMVGEKVKEHGDEEQMVATLAQSGKSNLA